MKYFLLLLLTGMFLGVGSQASATDSAATKNYAKQSIPEMAASINNCTPRPPENRDTSIELPFRNKQSFITNICQFVENNSMEYFYIRLKKELDYIKQKTGYCYTLKDPEIYDIIQCPNAGYNFNLMWHAAYHKARLMILEMVKELNLDVNQETGGYTVHDFISRQAEVLKYRISKLDKNSKGYAKKRELYLDMWATWCDLQSYISGGAGAKPGKSSRFRQAENRMCPVSMH